MLLPPPNRRGVIIHTNKELWLFDMILPDYYAAACRPLAGTPLRISCRLSVPKESDSGTLYE